jgi:hypothetical protein
MKKSVGMLLLFNANSAILQLYHGKNKLTVTVLLIGQLKNKESIELGDL